MSTYYTALKTTTRINDGAKVYDIIKEAATHYDNYGWQEDVLESKSLYEIADVFGICIHYTEKGLIPILFDTPGSILWYDILPKISPYMKEGKISGFNSDGEKFKIVFKNDECIINGNILLGIDYKDYGMEV